MCVYARLVDWLRSDKGCEVLIKGKRVMFVTGGGIWQPVSDLCSMVAGLELDSMDEALTLGPRSR